MFNYGFFLRVAQLLFLIWQITVLQQYFSGEVIGYFYIVTSLISLQLIGDLGLSQLTMNTIAKLLSARNVSVELSLRNVQNAARKILILALIFAGLFFLLSSVYLFWLNYGGKIINVEIIIIMAFFLAVDLVFVNLVSIVAGSIGANYYYRYKFLRLTLEYFITIFLFHAGYFEFAQAIGIVVAVSMMAHLLYKSTYFKLIFRQDNAEQEAFSIRPDFIKMLFKYSLTWLSGFFTFSMLIPLLSYGVTTEEIASMGALLAIFGGLNMFLYTMANQKTVILTQLGVKHDFEKIRNFIRSKLFLIAFGYTTMLIILLFFNKVDVNLGAARIADDLALCFVVLLSFFIHALAIPYVIVGNSLLVNNYAYRNVAWSVVNMIILVVFFYVLRLPLTLSLLIYSVLQIVLLYNIKKNIGFIEDVA